MDNDDEIMFHQMMANDAALEDIEDNHMVITVLLDAQAEMDATPKRGGSESCRVANKKTVRGQLIMCCCLMTIFRRTRQTILMIFVDTLG